MSVHFYVIPKDLEFLRNRDVVLLSDYEKHANEWVKVVKTQRETIQILREHLRLAKQDYDENVKITG